MQPEDVAIAAHETHDVVTDNAPEGRTAVGVDDESRVDGKLPHRSARDRLPVVEVGHLLGREGDVCRPGPSAVHRELGPVLLGRETDRGGLHAQGEILRDDRDRKPLLGKVQGDGEDARVVVAELQAARQHRLVRVVELDTQRAALLPHRDREVEALVLHPQLIEVPQRLTREVPDLRIVAFRLELGDDDDGEDDGMLREPEHGSRIAEEDRGVQDVGALHHLRRRRRGAGCLGGGSRCGHQCSNPGSAGAPGLI